jgi:hypothetical protein
MQLILTTPMVLRAGPMSAVPEPAAAVMLPPGLLMIARLQRRSLRTRPVISGLSETRPAGSGSRRQQ